MSICNYINWFFLYSFLGYLLECIVLTVEYKKPVVDRGFGHGPFLRHIRFRGSGRLPAFKPFVRSSHRIVYSIHDYGYDHGTDNSQCDDPAVWKFLVGLQP